VQLERLRQYVGARLVMSNVNISADPNKYPREKLYYPLPNDLQSSGQYLV